MAGVRPDMSDMRAIAHVVNAVEQFIEYIDYFQIITNLSRSLIAAAEQDAKDGKPPLTFSSDLGLIGPLYYTCVKCTTPSIHKEATELLSRCPRREGMWNSTLVAKVIEDYWEMEARHKAAQEAGGELDEFGFPVPLSETVDLIFKDGTTWEWEWEWKWKERRKSGPGFLWTDILQDLSIFQDFHSTFGNHQNIRLVLSE